VITHGKYHAYKKPGHYLLTVTVSDRAGNKTTKTQELVIKPKPKPKRKHRKHKQHGGRR
jgi:PKD repeat protein